MKKNEQKDTSRIKNNANQRNSVGSKKSRTETGKIRNRSNPQLPDKPRVVDRLQAKTNAGKFIHRPKPSTMSRGRPLKYRQEDGMIHIDGDESSYLQTFGTVDPDLGKGLFIRVVASLPNESPGDLNYILGAFQGIGPRDGIEGQLAALMVPVHHNAMDFMAKAAARGLPSEAVDANVNRANKFSRTFIALLEALNRHRGKIPQPMVVGNVNIADGGQAIVGPVSHTSPGKVPKDDEEKKVG